MATNRIAGMLVSIPAPAFVSLAPHVRHYAPASPQPGGPASFADARAEVLSGPWRLTLELSLDDMGDGWPLATPHVAVAYHGAAGSVYCEEDGPAAGGGWYFAATADELAALADGLREVADLLRADPIFAGARA